MLPAPSSCRFEVDDRISTSIRHCIVPGIPSRLLAITIVERQTIMSEPKGAEVTSGSGETSPEVAAVCRSCGRPIMRRRLRRDAAQPLRYCSRACRARRSNRTDRQLEAAIVALLDTRSGTASICPSEAARRVAGDADWRALLEPCRRAARRLAHRGQVVITQGDRVVDPGRFRGPIRIRRKRA